jgi:peptide/nickel transport system substrate-binding protein
MGKLAGRLIALVVAVFAMAVVTGCGSDDDDGGGGGGGRAGGEMVIGMPSQPDYLDPALSYTVDGWAALWLSYLPPYGYPHSEGTEGSEVIPYLAEELPEISNGGKTYKFKFRDGIKYSDGKPLKASDFEHTVKRVLNLESGGSFYYEKIKGAAEYVEAGKPDGDISGIETNDKTGEVTIELLASDVSFLRPG